MNYFAHYPLQECDPSSQNQQLYDQSTINYFSYSYSNPQYTSIHPYSYHNLTVQPSRQEEQEPNPPGVTPPPAAEQGHSSCYQLTGGPQPVAVDAGVPVVQQPIVQPLYGGTWIIDGVFPGGDAQTNLAPKPNVSHRLYHVQGRGRGRALHMNAAAASQHQTILSHGGSHIQQGGPLQPPPQPYAETHMAPRQNVSGFVRGRGKARGLHKRAAAPAQGQKVFSQGGSDIEGGPSQPMPHSAPVLPPPKLVRCELCKVECNTVEILKQHMNGKKHKKKLKVFEELQNLNKSVIGKQMEQTSTFELKSEVPSQLDQIERSANQLLQQEILPSHEIVEDSKDSIEERKLEEVKAAEESVKKVRKDHSEGGGRGLKRKMRGGKGSRKSNRPKKLVEPPKPKEVIPLVCELCNVKCESSVVFQSHLVGKKHQSKAKRFLSHQETLGQEPLQPQKPGIQSLDQQNANASTSIGSQLHDHGFGAYSAQNVKIIDVQASTSEANVKVL